MIEINHLSKHFAQHKVVDDLSFSVRPGEVLAPMARTSPPP